MLRELRQCLLLDDLTCGANAVTLLAACVTLNMHEGCNICDGLAQHQ
jgi:hypothetical protein